MRLPLVPGSSCYRVAGRLVGEYRDYEKDEPGCNSKNEGLPSSHGQQHILVAVIVKIATCSVARPCATEYPKRKVVPLPETVQRGAV